MKKNSTMPKSFFTQNFRKNFRKRKRKRKKCKIVEFIKSLRFIAPQNGNFRQFEKFFGNWKKNLRIIYDLLSFIQILVYKSCAKSFFFYFHQELHVVGLIGCWIIGSLSWWINGFSSLAHQIFKNLAKFWSFWIIFGLLYWILNFLTSHLLYITNFKWSLDSCLKALIGSWKRFYFFTIGLSPQIYWNLLVPSPIPPSLPLSLCLHLV